MSYSETSEQIGYVYCTSQYFNIQANTICYSFTYDGWDPYWITSRLQTETVFFELYTERVKGKGIVHPSINDKFYCILIGY